MKKTIVAATAAAFLAAATLAPARATPLDNGPVPLPAVGLIPIMLLLGSKENKSFKSVNPYEKRMKRHHHRR